MGFVTEAHYLRDPSGVKDFTDNSSDGNEIPQCFYQIEINLI